MEINVKPISLRDLPEETCNVLTGVLGDFNRLQLRVSLPLSLKFMWKIFYLLVFAYSVD